MGGRESLRGAADRGRALCLLDQLPLAVFTAAWDAVQWNPLWGELFGSPAGPGTRPDNLIRGHFAATSPAGASRIERDAAHVDAFERMMVSDLRRAADRYPDDRAVIELIDGLRATNPRFDGLWTRYETVPIGRSHKTVVHAELGEIVLDCDILTIERADLHIVLNWAAPDTGAAAKLAVLRERVAPGDAVVRR